MRIVPMAVLAASLAVSAVTPGFAQSSPFRFPGGGGAAGGSHGGGLGGGGFHGGGVGVNRPGFGGGQHFGNGPRPQGRRFVGGNNGYNGGYRHRGYGAAVGAGVAGLAAGALVGGALANQGYGYNGYGNYGNGYAEPVYGDRDDDDDRGPVVADQDEDARQANGDGADYCAQRYKSYDQASGTYLGFDGQRHPCP